MTEHEVSSCKQSALLAHTIGANQNGLGDQSGVRVMETDSSQIESSPSPLPARLLQLPPELRLMTYDLFFAATLSQDHDLIKKACYPLPPLFRVCSIVRNEALAPWKRWMTRTYGTEKLEVFWHKRITAEMSLILRERGGVEVFPRDNALMVWTLTARYRLLRMTTLVWCFAVIANSSGDIEAYLPSTEWEQ